MTRLDGFGRRAPARLAGRPVARAAAALAVGAATTAMVLRRRRAVRNGALRTPWRPGFLRR
jgi:hypothetical protein